MSGIARSHQRTDRSVLVPVGPTLLVRLVLAPMTKMLNPLVGKLAGRRRVPIAQLHHIGRRSGRSYLTSVGARVSGGVVLIPLTFGNQSDWVRNVYAAGRCSVHVKRLHVPRGAPAVPSRRRRRSAGARVVQPRRTTRIQSAWHQAIHAS